MSTAIRDRILEILAQTRSATVSELSLQLHTTLANIRYHMNMLISEGAIEMIPPVEQIRGDRGRPARRYRLSQRGKPNDLAKLASELLHVLLDSPSPNTDQNDILKEIAIQRGKQAKITGVPSQRLLQTVEFLNQGSYQAKWVARRAGPEIRFANCPFAAIMADHPALCQVDRLLVENLLNAKVISQDSFQVNKGFPNYCVFSIDFSQR